MASPASASSSALCVRRVRLLGAEVDLSTLDQTMAFLAAAAEQGRRAVIANHNAHSLHLVRGDPAMAAFYALADLVVIDSVPMVEWGRRLGLPLSREHRWTYWDWAERFWAQASARRWRVFYLGGAPGVAAEAARRIGGRWPGAEIAVHHGYFDRAPGGPENAAVLDAIGAFQPHVLFVGLGMPIQEHWIAANLEALPRTPILSVGAAFDYEAGVQARPARWSGALGVEWLYRLFSQPRRLFGRYLIEPWSLVGPALDDVRRYRLQRVRPPAHERAIRT